MNLNVLADDIDIIRSKRISSAIGVIFFILATALGAYVRIPVPGSPVPITLQTFFVVLSGAVLGKRLGLYSQLGYIFLGVSGVPLFSAGSSGLTYLLGPTGGYLIGFAAASYFVGRMLEVGKINLWSAIAAFSTGIIVIIYTFGVSWLILNYKMSAPQAISAGALPFIPGDMVKILFAAMIYKSISGRSRDIF